MIGKLDPEESVMDSDLIITNRRAKAIIRSITEKLIKQIAELNWECYDDVVVEIGGRSVSGIDVGEDYNPKWSSPKGTVKNNKDAFIIIKNRKDKQMKDLQLMYDVMQKSLDKDYNKDFDGDLSDVSKVLDWLIEFKEDNHDKIKFLKRWNR